MNLRFAHILGFATALALAACGARSTDEEKVRELFASAEKAAEARDSSDVLELVANGYSDAQGFDKASLGNFLRGYFLSHPNVELVVTVDSLEFPADGLARATLHIANIDPGNPELERVRVELRREGEEWQVARADRSARD